MLNCDPSTEQSRAINRLHPNRAVVAPLFCMLVASLIASDRPAHAGNACTGTGFEIFANAPTRVRIDDDIVPVLAASCEPNVMRSGALGGSGAAVLDYTGGFGFEVSTEVFAATAQDRTSEAIFRGGLFVFFTILPDDPAETGPVDVTITSRHDFGTVGSSTTDFGSASNFHRASFILRRNSDTGQIVSQWNSAGIPVFSGNSADVEQVLSLDVDQRYALFMSLSNESKAFPAPGAGSGTGSARLDSTNTFEITTDAAAEVVFDHEDLLGLGKPQLGVVPEPSAAVAGSVALLTLSLLRNRKRCQPVVAA